MLECLERFGVKSTTNEPIPRNQECQFDRDRKIADQVLERDAVRIMVDKSLQEPLEPFTEAERALHRDPAARRYFDDLKAKVKAFRRSVRGQRGQRIPTNEAKRRVFGAEPK